MATYEPYPTRYPRPRRAPVWPLVLLLVLAGVLGVVLWERVGWKFFHRAPDLGPDAVPRPVAARGELSPDEEATIEIYQKNSPSVVHINNLAERRGLFDLDVQQIPRGSGSGFVWDDTGVIVTNAHVVEKADAVEVVLSDKDRSSFETRAWVSYPDKDLAVLYVSAPKDRLRTIPLIGTSHDLKVGQKAYAIGNPFGLDQTLTTGVVSALNRKINSESGRPIQGVIQTSAAINPGNSGGPLLDSAGRLIGMNTAILSPSGTFAGIGFAIPVDEINRVVPTLVARLNDVVKRDQGPEEVSPPRMGVELVPDQQAQNLGVGEGALIARVRPGSPADQAGLRGMTRDPRSRRMRLGDVIVAIDGKPVQSSEDVLARLEGRPLGDVVTLTVERSGKRMDVQITLAPVR
jgi:S1-C subfamily serine protease